MRTTMAAAIAAVAAVVTACSSSTTTTSSGGDGGSTSSCSCNVTNNGVSKTIDCGSSACVAGTTFSCSSSGGASSGASCTDTGGGDAGGGGGGGGCKLFTCKTTSDCGGIAPCMSTSTGTSYCYEQEASPSDCSSGTTATTGTVDGSQRTLCVPSGCPQPGTYVPPP